MITKFYRNDNIFDMSFENPTILISSHERQRYLLILQEFIQGTLPTGAISDETEAVRLHRRLLSNEPISKDEVEKIIGQLGNSDDRGSLYH